jgi:hypothetical protein
MLPSFARILARSRLNSVQIEIWTLQMWSFSGLTDIGVDRSDTLAIICRRFDDLLQTYPPWRPHVTTARTLLTASC